MKRFSVLNRVVHVMGCVTINPSSYILSAVCTVRCPDDSQKFAKLASKEAAKAEKDLVEKILIGRMNLKHRLVTTEGKVVAIHKSILLPSFTEEEVKKFEEDVATLVTNSPQTFFRFNPNLPGTVKKNKVKNKLVTDENHNGNR